MKYLDTADVYEVLCSKARLISNCRRYKKLEKTSVRRRVFEVPPLFPRSAACEFSPNFGAEREVVSQISPAIEKLIL